MPTPRRACAALTLLAIALGGESVARAQLPRPRLQSLSRCGVRAGESADVTLRGTDLEGAVQLWFDHPGLRALHLKGLTFRVVCAAGTPVGHHDLRAVGTYGITNPRAFVVDDRPETVEVEPNNTPALAQTLALNSVVNGELAAADVDCFAIEGKKGERVFLDLSAERLDTKLDATLRIVNPSGQEVAANRDSFGADPFLDFTFPIDGRYVVKVHDVAFSGSPDHGYRLTLHDGPHLDAILPTSAPPGVATIFTVIGRNIGGQAAPDLLVDGRPLERKQVILTPPPSELDPAYPTRGYLPGAMGARRGFEYVSQGRAGASNPLFVAEAVDPVVLEKEPNDGPEPVQEVTPPCDVAGTFGSAGDVDIFRFRARKGDVWWIEADAELLGSPADPVFVLQRIVEKQPPQEIAVGDDLPNPGALARFNLGTVDAVLRWQVAEDGVYQVVVNDLYASQRGDARYVYRLNIRPERPDFRLFLVPETPNQPDGATVQAGGRASAFVLAARLDGFNGPIRVDARDLPPGVKCDPVVIGPGQALAPIVFEAAEDARPCFGIARVVGRGRVGDRKEEIGYVPGVATLGPDVVREAVGGGMIWPPMNPQAPNVAPARVVRGFALAVRDPAPFTLTATPATWTVAQGRQLNLDVVVKRRGEFTEAVTITQTDLPANLPPVAATIAKTATTTSVPLFLPKTVAPGVYTFLLQGTGPYPFSKDPNAKPKPNVNVTTPSNPITITVRPAPVSLAVNNKGGALKAGGSLEVEVAVARQNGSFGDVALSLVAPPALKLSAAPATVAEGQSAAKLVIRAAADSPIGPSLGIVARASGLMNGAAVEVDEPIAVTIAK